MQCKANYKDMEKYYAAKRRQQRRHRQKYGAGKPARKWTDEEINLLLTHEGYDRDLAKKLNRSLNAIYQKRSKILNPKE